MASSWGPISASRKDLAEGAGLGGVVGGGGDLQLFADRLDSPLQPTGRFLPVGVDVGNYFVDQRPKANLVPIGPGNRDTT